jgi:hypothetical protein
MYHIHYLGSRLKRMNPNPLLLAIFGKKGVSKQKKGTAPCPFLGFRVATCVSLTPVFSATKIHIHHNQIT